MRSSIRRFYLPVTALSVVLLISLVQRARANAPPCRYSMGSGTATDKETKLTWEQEPSFGTGTWDQAKVYCATLKLAGGGWRMPTIQELQTLVDDSTFDPAIDMIVFPSTPSAQFWSSSPYAGAMGPIWRINFYDGSVTTGGMSSAQSVRCVR